MRPLTRRSFVQWLAGAPLLARAGHAAPAPRLERIGRLIRQARAENAPVAPRIEFISRSLLGTTYQENTLVGGPDRPEQFVIRADAFDCVTYCEVVLAAALASDVGQFETLLRTIRYRRGRVQWDERNHYFAEWCRLNIEKKICQPVAMPDTVTIRKTVNVGNLGERSVSMAGIPVRSLLSNVARLSNGDIIGFMSRRPNLDFFHTGFVMIGPDGEPILRSASQRRRRVGDEPLAAFIAAMRVQHVALLRAIEQPPAMAHG